MTRLRVLWRSAAVLYGLVLAGCSPAYLLSDLVPDHGVVRTANVRYAPGLRHTLDIYTPPHAGRPLPMVVFLYGGDWYHGNKDMYGFVALPLAQRGAIVVVPDYRLAPAVAFPAFVDDNAAAVAWAGAHAMELGADPREIFVMGHSAGAYNAAMLALDPVFLQKAGFPRDRLAGVIGLAGPYNFLPITQKNLFPVFAPVDDGPLSQPIHYVDGRNPPMLVVAGSSDTTVMPHNTTSLAQAVADKGGPIEQKLYPGIGHIGLITAFAPLFQHRAPVLDDVWRFIQRHLRHAT